MKDPEVLVLRSNIRGRTEPDVLNPSRRRLRVMSRRVVHDVGLAAVAGKAGVEGAEELAFLLGEFGSRLVVVFPTNGLPVNVQRDWFPSSPNLYHPQILLRLPR